MKYILLMYNAEDAFSDEELPRERANAVETAHDLHARGQFLGGSPLRSVATATCVRVRNGVRLVSDGPFAETKEQLGGYVLVEVDSVDDAIEAASRFPSARKGTVEVRRCMELPAELAPGGAQAATKS